jgi:hypothetical protein
MTRKTIPELTVRQLREEAARAYDLPVLDACDAVISGWSSQEDRDIVTEAIESARARNDEREE